MSKSVLLNEDGAVAQETSDLGGIGEGGGGIGLVPDDDDGVLQGVIPRTGEPLDSTSGPSMAVVSGLREYDANWTQCVRKILGNRVAMRSLTHR